MRVFAVMIYCFIAACGSEHKSDTQSTPELFETQLESLEKSEDVEASLQEAVDEREKAMRERGI